MKYLIKIVQLLKTWVCYFIGHRGIPDIIIGKIKIDDRDFDITLNRCKWCGKYYTKDIHTFDTVILPKHITLHYPPVND